MCLAFRFTEFSLEAEATDEGIGYEGELALDTVDKEFAGLTT